MSCCAPGAEDFAAGHPAATVEIAGDELLLASHALGDGLRQSDLSVPEIHCAACIARIERGLRGLPGVREARVNLTRRRVSVRWEACQPPPPLIVALKDLGYKATLFTPDQAVSDAVRSRFVRAMAVAGFSAGNIMLLSVSVWSGADAATRDVFHWISALIALPALLYSGGVFYRSAWQALRHGRMNMDVPIALGITLAYALSLYETVSGGDHAYFDAVATLVFFLLVGRTLDHVMRHKARLAVEGLARLTPRGALVLDEDGRQDYVPLGDIASGMRLMIPAGARIPVDGEVEEGASDIDRSIVTGESLPQTAAIGTRLEAGTLNLTGPLVVRALGVAETSFLAEMTRMMEAAETGRARYRRIADRAADLYSPVVHVTALLTFVVWLWLGVGLHQAATIAIAVLIITCPCALGLAVPIVQVIAARRLFESGIMVKDGSALERLETVDTVVFDKTGTLTEPLPRPTANAADAKALAVAVTLASGSSHPLSRAIAALGTGLRRPALDQVREHSGQGISGRIGGGEWRLGHPGWALGRSCDKHDENGAVVLAEEGVERARFSFDEALRPGARLAVRQLRDLGLATEVVSGDTAGRADAIGRAIGVDTAIGETRPEEKVAWLNALAGEGRVVLMVGDGLNDAPALAAAHTSMAPSSAADIGRNAADFVFLRNDLTAVPQAVVIARRAGRLVRQNIGLAVGYNALAVPIAMLGHVTPLIAAIAMSTSSLIVIANALRLTVSDRIDSPADPRPVPSLAAAHG